MIRVLQSGEYTLLSSKTGPKVLLLGRDAYAWVHVSGIGDILVNSEKTHVQHTILSKGSYVLYAVQDEPHLIDTQHLELEIGDDIWQSYLLITGLPTKEKKRSRIISTPEHITGNPQFESISSYATHRLSEVTHDNMCHWREVEDVLSRK